MRNLFFVFFLGAAIFLVAYIKIAVPAERVAIAVGAEAMAEIEQLPVLPPAGTKVHRFVSYDASGGNGFGFLQSTFKRYIDSSGELVIFDSYGPGCLYRQQMNIWKGIGRMSPTLRIKYYFDNEDTARINVPVKTFFSGQYSSVIAPLTMMGKNDNFGINYNPIPFKERLKVTLSDTLLTRLLKENNDDGRNWYQYDYLTYPQRTKVESWTSRADKYTETVKREWTHPGRDPKDTAGNLYVDHMISIDPGGRSTVFDLKRMASVAGIQLKLSPYDSATFYNTYIRVYWDDLERAAIDMPISYFFGGGGPKDNRWQDSLKNLLFGFDATGHSMYCYWPMPFWENARIEILNKSTEKIQSLISRITYKPDSVLDYCIENAGYFMAKLTKDREEGAQTREFRRPYVTAFQEKGHGKVVSINMWSGNFLEDGDEFTYIDNERMPRVHGDGTEDDFNQGWGGSRYEEPLWGALISGVKGSYRIHMSAPYIFYSTIDIRFEQTAGRYSDKAMMARRRRGTPDSVCETEFVVCYYKKSGPGILKLTDSLDVGNPASEKKHGYEITGQQWTGMLTQSYDSYETMDNYNETTDDGRAFNGYSEFQVKLNPENEGVRLISRINRSRNGIQTAHVYIDGKILPTPWHIVTYSDMIKKRNRSFDGWFDSEYEIPKRYTQGRSRLKVKIEYVNAVRQRLNNFYYWVYCYGK